MTTPEPRARARFLCTLLALATACAGGGSNDGEGPSQGVLTEPDASTGTGASTGATEPGATDPGSTEPGVTESSASEPETGASDPGTSTGFVPDPPPECGALSVCGVQCTDLAVDPGNCGKCGISCVIPHATPACSAGACAISSCDPGWTDCDTDLQNGCEKMLAPGEQCNAVCKPENAESCNLLDDNCDGQCDEGAIAGCRQPVHRASSPTLGHFYTLDQAEASAGDYLPEFLNYYYTHVAPLPGLVPLYRCLKGDGRRFYTTSDTCEGAGPVEGVLGHIGTEASCGAVPLYRLYGKSDHFYTISAEERDSAVAMYGYIFEAQVGFVWPGP